MATLLERAWWTDHFRRLIPGRSVPQQASTASRSNLDSPSFAARCEIVESAMQQEIPFQQIEDYLDQLDHCRES